MAEKGEEEVQKKRQSARQPSEMLDLLKAAYTAREDCSVDDDTKKLSLAGYAAATFEAVNVDQMDCLDGDSNSGSVGDKEQERPFSNGGAYQAFLTNQVRGAKNLASEMTFTKDAIAQKADLHDDQREDADRHVAHANSTGSFDIGVSSSESVLEGALFALEHRIGVPQFVPKGRNQSSGQIQIKRNAHDIKLQCFEYVLRILIFIVQQNTRTAGKKKKQEKVRDGGQRLAVGKAADTYLADLKRKGKVPTNATIGQVLETGEEEDGFHDTSSKGSKSKSAPSSSKKRQTPVDNLIDYKSEEQQKNIDYKLKKAKLEAEVQKEIEVMRLEAEERRLEKQLQADRDREEAAAKRDEQRDEKQQEFFLKLVQLLGKNGS